jgi:hypothetical protein
MNARKPFALGTSGIKSYTKPETAVAKAEAFLTEKMGEWDGTYVTVIPTPLGDRWTTVLIFQGRDAVQAVCASVANNVGFACFA